LRDYLKLKNQGARKIAVFGSYVHEKEKTGSEGDGGNLRMKKKLRDLIER
jgi:hypothetical protein